MPFYIPSVDAKIQHQRVRSPLNTGINSPLMASSASKALDKHLLWLNYVVHSRMFRSPSCALVAQDVGLKKGVSSKIGGVKGCFTSSSIA